MRSRLILLTMLLTFLTVMLAPAVVLADRSGNQPAQACGPNVIHVVQRGENVFRLSLRYGTTMSAIAAANGLYNINRIYVGQRLLIPCAGQVPIYNPYVRPPAPTAYPPNIVLPPMGAQLLGLLPPNYTQSGPLFADCSRFRATSPLDGLANGANIFYWDGAPGATSYRVNIYNLDRGGIRVASYETGGLNTWLLGDVSVTTAGPGFLFAWEVHALVSDQVACKSGPHVMYRAVEQPPAPPATPPVVVTMEVIFNGFGF